MLLPDHKPGEVPRHDPGDECEITLEIAKVGMRARGMVSLGRYRLQGHQSPRIGDARERPQQHGIHPTEHSGVSRDAQSESHHGHGREARVLPQHSQPDAQVFRHTQHDLSSRLEDLQVYFQELLNPVAARGAGGRPAAGRRSFNHPRRKPLTAHLPARNAGSAFQYAPACGECPELGLGFPETRQSADGTRRAGRLLWNRFVDSREGGCVPCWYPTTHEASVHWIVTIGMAVSRQHRASDHGGCCAGRSHPQRPPDACYHSRGGSSPRRSGTPHPDPSRG